VNRTEPRRLGRSLALPEFVSVITTKVSQGGLYVGRCVLWMVVFGGIHCTATGVANLAAAADEWPQFRGPTGQGIASGHHLPVQFDDHVNVRWKTSLPGRGWSSPVVWDDQIWMTTAVEEELSLRAVCVDRGTGRVVHDVEVFHLDELPSINAKNSYASPTPVIEEGRLYVCFGALGTACLDTRSAEVVWVNRELVLDHKEGPGSSPVLFEDLLIVIGDGLDVQFVAALDKYAGSLRWRTERSGAVDPNPEHRKAYSTPLVIRVEGEDQLVCPGADRTSTYDPRTGEELWWVDYTGFSNVPRPVYHEGVLYLCTGYARPQLLAVRPGARGDLTETNVAWRFPSQVPAKPSPLAVGNRLFMVDDKGVATCVDLESGQEVWKARISGNYSASPISAGGHVYFFSEEGRVTVIETADEYLPLAVNEFDSGFMASAAVVGKTLLLRTMTHLYAIEEQEQP